MAGSARIDELKKKFDENPGRYFAPLANEYRKAGEIEQAITICRTYLAEKPGHMSGLIVFGQALFEAKQYDEARTTFEQALALDPENLIALRHLGDIARDVGDPVAARSWYQRVLDADPRNEEIAAQLALVASAAASAPAGPAPAAPENSGMSGWGDINPETPSADVAAVSSASTLIVEAVKPVTPSIVTEEPPRISLQMLTIEETAPSVEIEREEPTLGFEATSFDASSERSGGGSLGIERTQEFDIPGAGGTADGIELDRPFELPADLPSAPSDLGLEVSEFTPPSHEERPADLRVSLQLEPTDDLLGVSAAEAPAPETPAGVFDSSSTAPETSETVPGMSSSADTAATRERPREFALEEDTESPGGGGTERHEEEPSAQPAGFVTETMAELYLKQGYRSEAIEVYRKLVEQHPSDTALRDRLRGIESDEAADTSEPTRQSDAAASAPPAAADDATSGTTDRPAPAGRSARSFFGSLASRRAPQRASDPYMNSFQAPEVSVSPESGVTGPSDWIMEPAAPAPESQWGASEGATEPVPSSSSPVAADADAFGTDDAWPEAEPTAPAPAGPSGWGIAPVTDPHSDASALHQPPAAGESAAPVASSSERDARTRTPPRGSGTFSAIAEPEEPAAPPMAGSLDSLFGGASVPSADNAAASMLAGAFGPPETPSSSSVPAAAAPQQRGQPARAASSELSLDHVFRDSPRKSGVVRQTGGFSFDQFFSDSAVANTARPEPAADSGTTPAPGDAKSDDDVGQFTSWLQGLKKK